MDRIKYLILDDKSNIILTTVEEENSNIIDLVQESNKLIDFNGKTYRISKILSETNKIYAYTSDKQFLKSSSLFKTHVMMIKEIASNLKYFKSEVEKEVYRHVNILIHNLMTINAHSMQEIFNFIPQDELAKNTKNVRKLIKDKIEKDSQKSSSVLLKLMKNNLATKTEFSVFNKLFEDNPILNKKEYKVFDVLLNVLYNFFPDIIDKKVGLEYLESNSKAYFDYEAIQVALFHILDNTMKYIKENTKLVISLQETEQNIEIIFDMISLKVGDDELEKIFIEGFSGEYAKKNGKSGKGIGMSRVKQILNLNKGDILLKNTKIPNDDEYSNNVFILTLPKDENE